MRSHNYVHTYTHEHHDTIHISNLICFATMLVFIHKCMHFVRNSKVFVVDQCYATSVPLQGFRCAANFYKKLHIHSLELEKRQILSFIIDSFIQHVQCFFMCLHSYRASYLYVDTYLWSCIISYPLFVRRHFVVCRHVSLTNQGVPRVKKFCGTLW
jgi:hypothetical protein